MLSLPADLVKLFYKSRGVVYIGAVEGLEDDSGDHRVE